MLNGLLFWGEHRAAVTLVTAAWIFYNWRSDSNTMQRSMRTDHAGILPLIKNLTEVGAAFLRLGCISFGGPVAHIGFLRQEFVSRRRWVLGADRHRMMHLTQTHAPRFHLHPALWRLDVLERCCDLSLRDESGRGSAWHFEKTCEKFKADLPAEWKMACYQIAAHTLSAATPSAWNVRLTLSERWVFNRLMAILPWLSNKTWADFYARAIAMDDVFCRGPYPMIFSGILQKGALNRYLVPRFRKTSSGRDLIAQIVKLHPPIRKI